MRMKSMALVLFGMLLFVADANAQFGPMPPVANGQQLMMFGNNMNNGMGMGMMQNQMLTYPPYYGMWQVENTIRFVFPDKFDRRRNYFRR